MGGRLLSFRIRLAAAFLGALLAIALVGCSPDAPLPELSAIPPFELRDQHGSAFAADRLSGHVWIAGFIFTSCPDVCLRLTDEMRALRSGLHEAGAPVHLVSFTVDPETDTPAVLLAYSRAKGADHPDWHFLTGPLEEIERAVVGGFKQRIERVPGTPANILHGSHFVLVDAEGTIRGYYPSDSGGLRRLHRDAARLNESGGA